MTVRSKKSYFPNQSNLARDERRTGRHLCAVSVHCRKACSMPTACARLVAAHLRDHGAAAAEALVQSLYRAEVEVDDAELRRIEGAAAARFRARAAGSFDPIPSPGAPLPALVSGELNECDPD